MAQSASSGSTSTPNPSVGQSAPGADAPTTIENLGFAALVMVAAALVVFLAKRLRR